MLHFDPNEKRTYSITFCIHKHYSVDIIFWQKQMDSKSWVQGLVPGNLAKVAGSFQRNV